MSRKDFFSFTMGELMAAVDGYTYHMATMENWARMNFHIHNRSKKKTNQYWRIPYLDQQNQKLGFWELVAKRSGEVKFLQSKGIYALWDAMTDQEVTKIRMIYTNHYVFMGERDKALQMLKPYMQSYHLTVKDGR